MEINDQCKGKKGGEERDERKGGRERTGKKGSQFSYSTTYSKPRLGKISDDKSVAGEYSWPCTTAPEFECSCHWLACDVHKSLDLFAELQNGNQRIPSPCPHIRIKQDDVYKMLALSFAPFLPCPTLNSSLTHWLTGACQPISQSQLHHPK